jgi:hypothetical protein
MKFSKKDQENAQTHLQPQGQIGKQVLPDRGGYKALKL